MIASEQEFQLWEKLIDEGKGPYEAAREAGTTLTALGKGDRVRKQQGMELSRERRAAQIEKQIDERAIESDTVLLAKAKAEHPAYRDKRELTVTGTIEHEHRGEFTLGHLIEIARSTGVLGQLDHRPQAALPAAGALPPGPAPSAE